jgi:hypothetical protein
MYIYIYIYIYTMYDVFLFFMHVVADIDDFFVLSFSQSRLVVFCSRFIIMSCLTIIVCVAFPESLYCALRSQQNVVQYSTGQCSTDSQGDSPTTRNCTVFGINNLCL